jgi:hypothetical protein
MLDPNISVNIPFEPVLVTVVKKYLATIQTWQLHKAGCLPSPMKIMTTLTGPCGAWRISRVTKSGRPPDLVKYNLCFHTPGWALPSWHPPEPDQSGPSQPRWSLISLVWLAQNH